MTEPQTIKEAVSVLQKSIQAVLPDMEVSVNINLAPRRNINKTVIEKKAETETNVQEIPDQLSKDIDQIALRNFLNSYAKQAGKTKALKLVQEYAEGSKNPDDIPNEKYNDLVKQIATDCPGLEIPSYHDPEAA